MNAIVNAKILGAIAIIGSLLLIAGVFLDFMGLYDNYVTGWKIATEGADSYISYYYAPYISIAVGVLGLITAAVGTFVCPGKAKAMSIIGIILAIIAIVFLYLLYGDYDIGYGIKLDMGIGHIICFVGGVLLLLASLINIVLNKDAGTDQ